LVDLVAVHMNCVMLH